MAAHEPRTSRSGRTTSSRAWARLPFDGWTAGARLSGAALSRSERESQDSHLSLSDHSLP